MTLNVFGLRKFLMNPLSPTEWCDLEGHRFFVKQGGATMRLWLFLLTMAVLGFGLFLISCDDDDDDCDCDCQDGENCDDDASDDDTSADDDAAGDDVDWVDMKQAAAADGLVEPHGPHKDVGDAGAADQAVDLASHGGHFSHCKSQALVACVGGRRARATAQSYPLR